MKTNSKIPIVAIIVIFLTIAILNLPFFDSIYSIKPISTWQIENTKNISVALLWQKEIPCLTSSITSPHGTVAASDSLLVFARNCQIRNNELVALDIRTGEPVWTVLSSYSYQVGFINSTFFVIRGDSNISGIGLDGDKLWTTPKFPSRSVRYIYTAGDSIFVPRSDYTQIISIQTGEIESVIEEDNVIGVYDEYIIKRSGDRIQIINSDLDSSVFTPIVPNSEYYQSHTYTDRYQNVLLVYFGSYEIRAFDFETGTQIWSIQADFGSIPYLHNNRLFVYDSANTLVIYNPEDGQMLGSVTLKQVGNREPEQGIALAVSGNLVGLAYYNINQLVVLELEV